MKLIKRLLESIPKRYVISLSVFTLLFSLFNIYYIDILSKLTSTIASNSNNILKLVIFYVGYLIIWEIIEFIADVSTDFCMVSSENNLGIDLLNKIYKLKPSVIQKFNTGYINGIASQYTNQKMNAFVQVVLMAPVSIIYVVYCFVKMSQFHIIYGLALLAILTISIIFRYLGKNITEKATEELTTAESDRNKYFIDFVSNIGTAQKMQSIDYLTSIFKENNKKCLKKCKKFTISNEVFFTGFKLIIYLYLPIVCFIYYINPNLVEDSTALFSFIAVICVQLNHISRSICTALIELIKFKAKCNKLDEIVDKINYRFNILDTKDFETAEILNVEYNYYNKDNKITTTVKIPEFKVSKGDKICVYGESGQGKTTTLNILSGEIQTGKILINGKETDSRLDCCYIAQDNSIFDLSLRDNLTLGRNVSDDEIISLIDKCGLKDWYDRQADGLDTMLGERGVFVSTGQRQRLNLIRGLLVKDKEIYLLDEPTSNVDEETEDRMIQVINECIGSKTIVIVTHRPKIKSMCNKIYKFENGICMRES